MIQRYTQFWFFLIGLGLVSPPHFMDDFSRKMFFMSYCVNWLNFIVWLTLVIETLGNMCIVIISFPDCDVINFKSNLGFLIKPFSYMTKNFRTIIYISSERKESFGWNKRYFSVFLKGFHFPEIVSDLRVLL